MADGRKEKGALGAPFELRRSASRTNLRLRVQNCVPRFFRIESKITTDRIKGENVFLVFVHEVIECLLSKFRSTAQILDSSKDHCSH